jgi:polysaccharide pyruvyl transferase WcaK-like protein
MKKISIITILDNQNIGTYLQAYAFSEILKERGADPSYINYRRKHESVLNNVKHILKKRERSFFHSVISAFYRMIVLIISKRKMRIFIKKNANLSEKKYSSSFELKKSPPLADLYITGSDQVWNSIYNKGIDAAYFLDFAPECKKRIAYAASIGMDSFPLQEEKFIVSLLLKYDAISVREMQAAELLKKIGIPGVKLVLDPTLLLNKTAWEKIGMQDTFKKEEPYLLIYSVEDSRKDLVSSCALQVAQERNLKIYQVSSGWFRDRVGDCDRYFSFSTPQRFINLIMQADFMVVSSFHGTAFSVNLNKQFVSVCPDKYNSRIENLLTLLRLENRIVRDKNFTLPSSDYDADLVNEILQRERRYSMDFINLNVFGD